jgi:hypothetical protein
MVTPRLIGHISAFIWLLPGIRQIKSRYRYYFLIVSATALLSLGLVWMKPYFRFMNYLFIAGSFLLLMSVLGETATRFKKIIPFVLALIIIMAFTTNPNRQLEVLLLLLLHAMVLLALLRTLLMESLSKMSINLFLLFMILYELSLVIKFFMGITSTVPSIFYYKLSTGFEIFMAIVFIIFNDAHPWLQIRIRTTD